MGRKVQPRINYFADARFIMRTMEAIEKDILATDQWRSEVIEHCKALSKLFLERAEKKVTDGYEQGENRENPTRGNDRRASDREGKFG